MTETHWHSILKDRVAPLWMRFLETMANGSAFPLGVNNTQKEVKVSTDAGVSAEYRQANSWEELLAVLIEETVVQEEEHLQIRPIFMTLPSILQSRFLFMVRVHFNKISTQSVHEFLLKIKESKMLHEWTLESLRQLEVIAEDTSIRLEPTKQDEKWVSRHYKFQSPLGSNGLLDQVLDALRRKRDATVQMNLEPKTIQSQSTVNTVSVKEMEANLNCLHQNIVDVIVIDDDDDDDKDDDREFPTNQTIIPKIEDQNVSAYKLKEATQKRSAPVEMADETSAGYINGKKRKLSCSSELEINNSTCSKALILKKENVVNKADSETNEDGMKPSTVTSGETQTSGNIPEDLKMRLEVIRESWGSFDNGKAIPVTDLVNCLNCFKPSQIEDACEFLAVGNITEKTLVNLCDSVPWKDFGYDASHSFIVACFRKKLTELSAQASHTLMTAMTTVAQDQAKVLIDVLTDILSATHSGVFQCQLLASVCKNSLAVDAFDYLIRKLSAKDLIMGEQLALVLQAVVDRRPDLQSDTLTLFLRMLCQAGCESSTNPKLGNLLLSFINKYGRKMSRDQLASLSALVDGHRSNLKKVVVGALKRLL